MSIRDFIPPFLHRALRAVRRKKYGWFGNYPSWEAALHDSTGYDSLIIGEKVKNAILKVKNGEAVYERDSVLFDRIEYSWPLLSGLLWVASIKKGKLIVIDFGGSLGSTYFQNIKFLKSLPELRWNIVEQPNYVDIGIKNFQDDKLRFYHDLDECVKTEKPDVIIFSGVLQYLSDPYSLIKKVGDLGIEFIIVDLMPFSPDGNDHITIQKVPPEIYPASYPCWILGKQKFLSSFDEYTLVEEFRHDIHIHYKGDIAYQGFIFQRSAK